MKNKENIIKDAEENYGIELDPNFDSNALCEGDTCGNQNCTCWSLFEYDVCTRLGEQERELDRQEIAQQLDN